MRWYVAAAACVLAVIVARVWTNGRAEWAQAQSSQGIERLDRLQWAMRWYLPGAQAPRNAADALSQAARDAEQAGRPAQALAAWRRLRGGILTTRHLWSPFGDRLPVVNQRIAALVADQQLASGAATIRGRDRATLVADHLALLEADPTPEPGWGVMVFLGFLGWAGGAAWTIRQGLTAQGKIRRTRFLRGLAFTLACFAVWVFGLINA